MKAAAGGTAEGEGALTVTDATAGALVTASTAGALTEENLKEVAGGGASEEKDDHSEHGSSGKGSDAGTDSSSDTDSSSGEDQKGLNLRKVVKIGGKVGKELKKLFINYGPPYRKYGGPDDIATSLLQDTLLNECCKPEAYISEIHGYGIVLYAVY
jgi:hypothetical protein